MSRVRKIESVAKLPECARPPRIFIVEIILISRHCVGSFLCHSVSAVLNGKCVDTSMGLTPLEGLVMKRR